MINALQLIIHVPIFNLKIPANAQYMYSFIIDVTNFNLIPEKYMNLVLDYFDIGEQKEE